MGRRSLRSAGVLVVALTALAASAVSAQATTPNVLLVGSYHGVLGPYTTIQSAVSAAQPGDWILVGPGDYHESADYVDPSHPAGVAITTSNLHLRGMDRNGVVIDGTKAGSPECSSAAANQDLGPKTGSPQKAQGRNGIEVFGQTGTANNVSLENLTVCNFLTSATGDNGNEIWWNGGDGKGHVNMNGYTGNYLTATATYSNSVNYPAGSYGIFVSDATNGLWSYDYASNMADSDYYIGACQQICNAHMTYDHGQYASLCLSSTNAGGYILVEHTECDLNKTGLVSNAQNNDDWPSPQYGACPTGKTGPIPAATKSCTVWAYDNLHDNNNPDVPGNGTSGLAGGGPVGTGAILAGTQNVTMYKNTFTNNGSWGELVVDLPDQEQAPSDAPDCKGGTAIPVPTMTEVCLYRAVGNISLDNMFSNNGTNGNPGNGDIGLATFPNNAAGNCFSGDTDTAALGGIATTDPAGMEVNPAFQPSAGVCTQMNTGDMGLSGSQALCSSQLLAPCPSIKDALCAAVGVTPCPLPGVPGNNYPRPDASFALHMPPAQTTMADPCAGVPANAFCASNVVVSEFPWVAPAAGLVALGTAAVWVRRRQRSAPA